MLDPVDVIVAMQSLARRTGPDIEGNADTQQRIDSVLLDDVLTYDAELVLQDVRAEVLQDWGLADLCDGG